MIKEPDSGPIWGPFVNGTANVGALKPHSRLTVEPGWVLRTTNVAGSRSPNKLPVRYFQRLDNSQQEVEIPGVRSLQVIYDIDADADTLNVTLVNNHFDPDYGAAEWANANGDFGAPGYLTAERGVLANRWGYFPNEWAGLLTRDALIRCVDTATEILTRRGWLTWDMVKVGDEALGINPATGGGEWQHITDVFTAPYEGEMVRLRHRHHDSLTTPDHKWLVKTKSGTYKWKTSRTLTTKDFIPLAARQTIAVDPVYEDDLVELAAWYFTEGTAEHRLRSMTNGGSIAQSGMINPDNVERIRGVFSRLFGEPGPLPLGTYVSQETVDEVLALRAEGLSYRKIAAKVGVCHQSVERWVLGQRSTNKRHKWRESRRADGTVDFRFTAEVAMTIRSLIAGPDKVPTVEFVTSMTQEQLDLFIEVCLLGDGTVDRGSRKFLQGHADRVSAFEFACVLAGRGIHTAQRPRGGWVTTVLRGGVCSPLSAQAQRETAGRRSCAKRGPSGRSTEAYAGIIWCPTVRHGNWIARRNGTVFVTGNTYEGRGGQAKTLAQCLADGNLVLTGVWLIDDTPIQAGQGFQLTGRSMAKLLLDQPTLPPLIPDGDYPLTRARFHQPILSDPVVVYGHLAPNPHQRVLRLERPKTSDGYWLMGTDGGIFSYGLAHFYGSMDTTGTVITPAAYPNVGVAAMCGTPGGEGYYLVTSLGAVYAFGDAVFHGSQAGPSGSVVSIESSGPIDGYWLFTSNGSVYTFGSAGFHGSAPPLIAGHRIVDAASTPSGLGYWLVDDLGHVYAYGDANYFGGLTSAAHPVVAIAPTPDGAGYYLCATDGGVFCFGDAPFYGSAAALTLNDPMSDMVVSVDGSGYWLCAEDGGVFTYTSAASTVQFYGSMPGGEDTEALPGNYLDISDVVEDLALYSGFHLYDGGATDNVYGVIEKTGVYSPDAAGGTLDATFFDRQAIIDVLKKFRDAVGFCHDESTQIFTRRGWLAQQDLQIGDFTLAIDPATGESTWVKVEYVYRSFERGTMYSLEGKNHSSLTTANHRWLTYEECGGPRHRRREVRWQTTDTLRRASEVPTAAPCRDLPKEPTHNDDFVDLVAWWWTEGSYAGQGGVIGQSLRANEANTAQIDALFRRLYGPPAPIRKGVRTFSREQIEEAVSLVRGGMTATAAGERCGGISTSTVLKWVGRPLPEWGLWQRYRPGSKGGVTFRFGPEVRAQLHAVAPGHEPTTKERAAVPRGHVIHVPKVPTREFLLSLTADQLGRFIETSVAADGHKHQFERWKDARALWQKDADAVASFEFACALAGIATGTVWIDYRKIHRVGLHNQTITKPVEAAQKQTARGKTSVYYEGVIWCPTVERFGNFLARRNGKVFYSGNCLYVDQWGGLHYHEANIWESGNFLPDHSHTLTVPVLDERINLTSYQLNRPDKDIVSQILISSAIPEDGIQGIATTIFTPAQAGELRGLVKPAEYINALFIDESDQQTMAELIALQLYFKSRLGVAVAMGCPMIEKGDQVQIIERETAEQNTFYVRKHERTHDRKTGSYLSTLTVNVLSPPGTWAVVKPDNSPSGTVTTNRHL